MLDDGRFNIWKQHSSQIFFSWTRNTIYLIQQSYMFLCDEDFCLLVSIIIFLQVGHTNMGLGSTSVNSIFLWKYVKMTGSIDNVLPILISNTIGKHFIFKQVKQAISTIISLSIIYSWPVFNEGKSCGFRCSWKRNWASQVVVVVKNPPANAGDIEIQVRSLGWEDPLKEGIATHSNILAWRIPMDREA